MLNKWLKGGLVVIGAVVLSTLGIFAADSLQGINGNAGQLIGGKKNGVCQSDAVPVSVDGRILCIDAYEASPSEKCPHASPTHTIQSEANANANECHAVSIAGKNPWNFISLPQAQRACASAGKRLPTNDEWYQAVLGTNPDMCTIQGNAVTPTGNNSCVSSIGAYDLVGNVWEWVNEEVVGNTFNGRQLPQEGYVTSVDAHGVAVTTGEAGDPLYGNDYTWSKSEGVYGMIRGGFYGGNGDAGLYTVNASVVTSFASQGVGFRCVKDVF